MSKKKWFVTVTLMRGVGEQHMFIKLDIEQARQLFRFILESYQNCVETPVEDPLMEKIIDGFSDMDYLYTYLEHLEQSGLD